MLEESHKKIAFQALICASVYEKIYLYALKLCNGYKFNAGMKIIFGVSI